METTEINPPQLNETPQQNSTSDETGPSYTNIFLITGAVMFVIISALLGYIFSERIFESIGVDRRELASHIDSILALGMMESDEKQEEPFLRITTTLSPTLLPSITTSPAQTPTTIPSPTTSPTVTPTPSPTPTPTPTPVPEFITKGIEYIERTVPTERGNFFAKVIKADLNYVNLVVDSANTSDCDNNCPVKSLSSYIIDNNAIAGINGTYFCPPEYSECSGKVNSYDFTIYNSNKKKWINWLSTLWNDRAILFNTDKSLGFDPQVKQSWKKSRLEPWPALPVINHPDYKGESPTAAISNYPGLLENGNIIVNNYPLTDKMKIRSTKMGIGYTGNTVMLVAGHGVSMEEFAYVFKALGATDALNLDAGGSAAMWYNGYKIGPGRLLPNAIVITRK